MKKHLIGTIGYYGDKRTPPNGQAIRTENITKALEEAFRGQSIRRITYHEWRRKPFSILAQAISIYHSSENIIIFPDANAIKALLPLTLLAHLVFGNRIFYVVIGGWIVNYLRKSGTARWVIRRYNRIFVQTTTLMSDLKTLGVKNVKVLPNFKVDAIILPEDRIVKGFRSPLPICFYSRVIAEKGIEDLIEALRRLNRDEGVYRLDVYGPIGPDFRETFERLMRENSPFVRYMGTLSDKAATDTLSCYFMQVFPTRFLTEGFPGSILDSYNAGLPVLVARWNSWSDVVEEGREGLSYERGDVDALTERLMFAAENTGAVNAMRRQCIERAYKYDSRRAIGIISEDLARGPWPLRTEAVRIEL